jgi:hypothetical protein
MEPQTKETVIQINGCSYEEKVNVLFLFAITVINAGVYGFTIF